MIVYLFSLSIYIILLSFENNKDQIQTIVVHFRIYLTLAKCVRIVFRHFTCLTVMCKKSFITFFFLLLNFNRWSKNMNHLNNTISIEQNQEQVEFVNRYCVLIHSRFVCHRPVQKKIVVSIFTTRN